MLVADILTDCCTVSFSLFDCLSVQLLLTLCGFLIQFLCTKYFQITAMACYDPHFNPAASPQPLFQPVMPTAPPPHYIPEYPSYYLPENVQQQTPHQFYNSASTSATTSTVQPPIQTEVYPSPPQTSTPSAQQVALNVTFVERPSGHARLSCLQSLPAVEPSLPIGFNIMVSSSIATNLLLAALASQLETFSHLRRWSSSLAEYTSICQMQICTALTGSTHATHVHWHVCMHVDIHAEREHSSTALFSQYWSMIIEFS